MDLATCFESDDVLRWSLMVLWIFGFVVALFYIGTLLYLIEHSKISSRFHEQSIQKKEIEFVLGINQLWKTSHFYTFASFRGGY